MVILQKLQICRWFGHFIAASLCDHINLDIIHCLAASSALWLEASSFTLAGLPWDHRRPGKDHHLIMRHVCMLQAPYTKSSRPCLGKNLRPYHFTDGYQRLWAVNFLPKDHYFIVFCLAHTRCCNRPNSLEVQSFYGKCGFHHFVVFCFRFSMRFCRQLFSMTGTRFPIPSTGDSLSFNEPWLSTTLEKIH